MRETTPDLDENLQRKMQDLLDHFERTERMVGELVGRIAPRTEVVGPIAPPVDATRGYTKRPLFGAMAQAEPLGFGGEPASSPPSGSKDVEADDGFQIEPASLIRTGIGERLSFGASEEASIHQMAADFLDLPPRLENPPED